MIPKDGEGHLKRIRSTLIRHCRDAGFMSEKSQGLSEGRVKHIALISAKTGFGVEELVSRLMCTWKRKGRELFRLRCDSLPVMSCRRFNQIIC